MTLEIEDHGRCLVVRLARAEKKNALNLDMYERFCEALDRLDREPGLHVLVVLGGREAFSSGHDIEDFLAGPSLSEDHPTLRFLHRLASVSKPVIAGVSGVAVGVGTTMLLHCDLVYASDTAHFEMPFIKLGLVPEAASSLLLPRLVGHQKASELLLLGKGFDAEKALQIGLVNAVVSPQDLEDFTLSQARLVAEMPLEAVIQTKRLVKSSGLSVAKRIDDEIAVFARLLNSEEARKAFKAFLGK